MDRVAARLGPALALAGVVALILVPVPTPLVDVLIAANLGLAILLVLGALSIRSATSLSTLPSVLILATLFRLALNVSTTRLILVQADAGRMVQAFGELVVGGSYLVGGVVFAIITVVQYVVIAAGAGRVAEVAARFALDALPGNQAAIDADLRAGSIGPAEAQRRRAALQTESRLYGALDGASRLVRGDAVAGVLITLVNLAGGVLVGTTAGMGAAEAARTYGLLTIGDGLAAQIPALLISVATGLVVTRVADASAPGRTLGDAAARQVLRSPENLLGAGLLVGVLGLVPGLPTGPLVALGVVAGLGGWHLVRRRAPAAPTAPPGDRLCLRLGPDLASALGVGSAGDNGVGRAVAAGCADRWPVEGVGVEVAAPEGPDAWQLRLDGLTLAHGVADPSDPQAARRSVVAAAGAALRDGLDEVVGVQEVGERLAALAEVRPLLVRETIPGRVDLPTFTGVVRCLLSEGLPAGDLRGVLEPLAALAGPLPVGPVALAERLRPAFRGHLVRRAGGDHGGRPVDVWGLDEELTVGLEAAARRPDHRGEPSLDPLVAADLRRAAEEAWAGLGAPPVVMTTAAARRATFLVLRRRWPESLVLGPDDVGDVLALEPAGTLRAG